MIGTAIGIALGTFAFLFIVSSVAHQPLVDIVQQAKGAFLNVSAQAKPALAENELLMLEQLLKSGRVTTLDNLVGNIISYFSVIVTTLIGVVALLGAVAFFYIRQVSISHAEETSRKAIEQQFTIYTESSKFSDLIRLRAETLVAPDRDALEETLEGINQRFDNLKVDELIEMKAKLERLIAAATDIIARTDTGEDIGEDMELKLREKK
jgi:hypothetical protein